MSDDVFIPKAQLLRLISALTRTNDDGIDVTVSLPFCCYPGKIKRLILRVKTRSDDLLVYFRENEDKKRVQKNSKYKFSMNFQYAYKCV